MRCKNCRHLRVKDCCNIVCCLEYGPHGDSENGSQGCRDVNFLGECCAVVGVEMALTRLPDLAFSSSK